MSAARRGVAAWAWRTGCIAFAQLARNAEPQVPGWYHASLNRFYVDEIFNLLFVQPLNFLALSQGTEALIYDIVRLIAAVPRGAAT